MISQISAQDFLKESGLFSLGFSNFTVGFRLEVEDSYSFYIPNFFSINRKDTDEERKKDFDNAFSLFITEYLIAWYAHVKTQKDGLRDEDYFLRKLSSVSNDISNNGVFSEVVSRKKSTKFEVVANKSVFNIMRFGDCLGVQLQEGHKGGTAAIETLRANRDNMFCPQLFIKSISSWMLLPVKRVINGNDKIVDFSWVINRLNIILKGIQWSGKWEDVVSGIIEIYKENSREGFCVGNYCGIPIYARITHGEDIDKTDIRSTNYYPDDVRIWRSGNVQTSQNLKYKFKDSTGLSLVLSVKNSLPSIYSSNPVDDKFKNHKDQLDMKAVGAIINTQLHCMMMQTFMESQIKGK